MAAFNYTTVQLVALGFAAASALVGLFIGYQAFLGLRRNSSQQMLFLSIGLILLFGVTYGISLIGTFLFQFRLLPLPAQDLFRMAIRLIQFVALLCIAYSMYIDPEGSNKSTNE